MTKTVLISLEELLILAFCEDCEDYDFLNQDKLKAWFYAQPDASEPDYGKHCNDSANHSGNACEGRMVRMSGLVCEKCGWESA